MEIKKTIFWQGKIFGSSNHQSIDSDFSDSEFISMGLSQNNNRMILGNSKFSKGDTIPWRKKKTNKHHLYPIFAIFIDMPATDVAVLALLLCVFLFFFLRCF